MRKLGLIEIILAGLLIFFIFNVWGWWNNGDIIRENTTVIIALATIVYAVFTFFMFWSMKSSSEAQVRPLLFTNLKEDMDLIISNHIEQNGAKNVKIRIRALPISRKLSNSKSQIFIQKYLWRPMWSFPWDYFKSHKIDFEVLDGIKTPSLSRYIADTLFKGTKWATLITTNADPKEGEIQFKLLIHISYESLLDIKYDLDELYLVSKTPNGTKIIKNPDYH